MTAKAQGAVLCMVLFSCGKSSSPSGRLEIGTAVDTGAEDSVDAALVDTPEDAGVVDTPGDETGDGVSSEDAPPIVTKDLCTRMCDVLALVDCPNQRAPAACTEKCFEDGMICTPEHKAYFECIVATGPTAFDCDPDFSILVLNPGFCALEGDALVGCLANKP